MASPSTTRALPKAGDVVAGKYRFVRRLGAGGMGVVYEAEHTRMQQRVAIKMLLPEVLDQPDIVSRFQREARAAGKLKSENTARVIDVDVTDDGMPYMVMEFLEGADLGEILARREVLPVVEAVDFVLQTCNAMAEAHAKGVIHRDLKPSNLFVTGDGAATRLKVLDFGISKLENDNEARVTSTQTAIGTPLYMSPEQIRSAKHVDARTDIWSLGVILYELLAGRTPWEGSATAAAAAICLDPPPPLRQLRPEVPEDLERAVLGALQKTAADRFQTVQDLAAAIAPFGSGTVAKIAAPPTIVTSAHSSLSRIESARTLPAAPGDSGALPRAAGTTLPGWTTRATSNARRARRWVAVIVGALALFATGAFALRYGERSHEIGSATQPSVDTPPPQPSRAPSISETTTAATAEPVPSESVSATPTSTTKQVQRAHPAATHAHAPAPAPSPTPTPTHSPAPAPTRL